ncbi:RNA-directed DNA polymerase, eukaryota, reverse transcriptase zinc-binding domain protein, partial [Tanacetum coccineum]
LGYARVLVEIDAEKEYVDKVELSYMDDNMNVKRTKWVNYWKPERCTHCRVFGHSFNSCKSRPKTVTDTSNKENKQINKNADDDGFMEVMNRKNKDGNYGYQNYRLRMNQQSYRRNMVNNNFNSIRREVEKDKEDEFADKRLIVDQFIKKRLQPSVSESQSWTYDMIQYFKYKWEALERKKKKGYDSSDEENVIVNDNKATQNIIADESKVKVYASFIYAFNSNSERRRLWDNLMMSKNLVGNKPWLLVGYFNVTLKPEEHYSGPACITNDMGKFNDAMNSLEIEDLVMINDDFVTTFNKAHYTFLPFLVSDHSPAIINFPDGLARKKKSFRFINYIADKSEFMDIVKEVVVIKQQLKEAQSRYEADPFNKDKRFEAVDLFQKYSDAAEDELNLLHQTAKVKWVESICNENGVRFEGAKVAEQFVNHFENFLGKSGSVKQLNLLGNIVNLKLSEEDASRMIIEVSDEEIKAAMFDIDGYKAAGPDGFTSCFFKKSWHLVSKDICLAIKEFLANRKILGEINATIIALVPKVDTPDKVTDFRPIACCNVLYKCISKILSNRIKDGLSKVVSLNHSAFILGRHIQDKRCAMKINIQKAYDTVDWVFLKDVLTMVGFHATMVKYIMTCITSTSFSIYVNREACGFFKGGRGLRHRDPISPNLFTLVMEVFNMILIKEINESKKFKFHYGCKELQLTHMCFANDLLVLCNGDKESLEVVKKALDEFSNVSGLFPNLGKSTIFFGSLNEGVKRELLQVMPFKCGSLPMKYLGVSFNIKNAWGYRIYVYMLPYSVIKDLEKLFKGFLWNAGDSAKVKNDHYPVLRQINVPSLTNKEDTVLWLNVDNKELEYSTKVVWNWDVWKKIQVKGNINWRNFKLQTVNERNRRCFQNSSRTTDELIRGIENNVVDMLKSLKLKKSANVLVIANKWGLKWDKNKLTNKVWVYGVSSDWNIQ